MTFNQIKMALYATYLTNYFGFQLKKASSSEDKKRIRTEYSRTLLDKLHISINVLNPEKVPQEGQYLLASNHRSIIDPLIVELAVEKSKLFGHWISKKELYNSLFFGLFVKNAGTILVDREKKQMGGFFSDIKKSVGSGDSIYIFPEGTRNKTANVLTEFQGGAQMIALKNRIKILPVFIKTQANDVLMQSLQNGKDFYTIDVEFGEPIDPKERSVSFEEAYKSAFKLSA